MINESEAHRLVEARNPALSKHISWVYSKLQPSHNIPDIRGSLFEKEELGDSLKNHIFSKGGRKR
jgi:hypothetical protein